MKTIPIHVRLLVTLFAGLSLCSTQALAAETKDAREQIGIYDSRVVAYAHFWSDAHQKGLKAQVKLLKTAKAAGDTQRAKELEQAVREEQRCSHRQVFSTAPVDDVLAEIKDRLPEIRKEAGVSKLVSKWDKATLKQYRGAERVDVTDLLVREFKPGEKQLKVIADIKRQKPVPLDKIDKVEEH
jgi:hypothetical protein